MSNSGLKAKIPLEQLTRFGTEARKSIHPNILIGGYDIYKPVFKEGDILDANATYNLIQKMCMDGSLFNMLQMGGKRIFERIDNIERTTDINNDEIIALITDIKEAISLMQELISELREMVNTESSD